MSVQLSSFINSFSNELARPSKFDVTIIPISTIASPSLLRQLTLRCETAELPSRTFGTVDQKFGSNPTQKYPIHSSYNDLTLSFIVSGDMSEKVFFDNWMELINPTVTFDFTYKEQYQATIYVNQYDLASNTTYQCILYNAYPITVNQLDLDWSTDSVHKLTVVFAYDYWQNSVVKDSYIGSFVPLSNTTNVPTGSASLFQASYQTSGAIPTGQPRTESTSAAPEISAADQIGLPNSGTPGSE